MKKKLDTRFPTARIKKIMQADEEVGKIAMATPVLISKALELFLQDLCDKAYEVAEKRGAKTLTGAHFKQCVMEQKEFDFLKEIVSKVSEKGSGGTDEAKCEDGGKKSSGISRRVAEKPSKSEKLQKTNEVDSAGKRKRSKPLELDLNKEPEDVEDEDLETKTENKESSMKQEFEAVKKKFQESDVKKESLDVKVEEENKSPELSGGTNRGVPVVTDTKVDPLKDNSDLAEKATVSAFEDEEDYDADD